MRLHSVLGALFGESSGWAWGLSIVFLVMLIRLCLVPLFVKQVNAQRKMAKHQPQLMELRKKYKNDKQRLNEETMKFYKENGVNPLAGCLPMIPQMIVFFSLFSVLRFIADWKPGHPLQYGFTEPVVISAKATTIFGVHLDSKLLFAHPAPSLHVAIIIALTVVVSATTTFMTVRQSAKRGLMQTNLDPDNPMAQSQKFMQYIVPFFSRPGPRAAAPPRVPAGPGRRPARRPLRPARPPGRTARKSAGCCDWAGLKPNPSPRTTCPPLRWCGSNRCGRRKASGRASGDGNANHSERYARPTVSAGLLGLREQPVQAARTATSAGSCITRTFAKTQWEVRS